MGRKEIGIYMMFHNILPFVVFYLCYLVVRLGAREVHVKLIIICRDSIW